MLFQFLSHVQRYCTRSCTQPISFPDRSCFVSMHAPCVPDDYIIHIHQNTNTPPRATRPKVGLAGSKVSETPINLQIRLRQHVARHGLIYMHNRRNELDMDLFIMYIAYIGTMRFTHDKEWCPICSNGESAHSYGSWCCQIERR